MWMWFNRELPGTPLVAAEANRKIQAASPGVVQLTEGADPALVGTAVDYLVRVSVRPGALDDSVAAHGAALLDRIFRLDGRAIALEREAVDRIEALEPWRGSLPARDWEAACRWCLVLGRLEQVSRALAVRGGPTAVIFKRTDGGLDELATAMADRATVSDLAALGSAAAKDHADLRFADPLILNPRFKLSAALGGADADLIAEQTLLDLKSAQRSVVRRPDLWQIVGYALSDTTDEYRIQEVGISALRWRTRVTWNLDELLAELSGREQPLTTWRESFADAVAAARWPRANAGLTAS